MHFRTNKTGKKEHFFLADRTTAPNIWTIKTRDCNILHVVYIHSVFRKQKKKKKKNRARQKAARTVLKYKEKQLQDKYQKINRKRE